VRGRSRAAALGNGAGRRRRREVATYETDPRIAQVHGLEIASASEELRRKHPMDAQRPEQCFNLMDHMFMNWSLMASYEVPSYRDWILTANHAPAYEAHRRRMLQHLQFRHPGRWS
jgi:hypothetical protein